MNRTPPHDAFGRRSFLIAATALPLLAACGSGSSTAPLVEPGIDSTALDTRIAELERRYTARIGLSVTRPSDDARYSHRADEPFAHCSTFKVYAVAALLRSVAVGRHSLDNRVPIDPARVVANSPVTAKAAGSTMTLRDLSFAALTQSDNTAANCLLDAIGGPAAITAFARSVGDTTTRGDRMETELNTAIPGDPRDTSTPAGLAAGFRETLLGSGLAPADRRQLQDWMRASLTSAARIRAGLPPGWTSADKTGSGDYGTVNDAGLIWNPAGDAMVLAILTTSTAGRPDVTADGAIVADVTKAVTAAFDAGR